MQRAEAFAALAGSLTAEAAAYRELLRTTAGHHAALIAGTPAGVEASLHEQVAALGACRRTSDERARATQALAAELGLPLPCSTGRLLGALPEAEALRGAHAELGGCLAELRALNAANRRLDEHRLDLLEGDVAALRAMLLGAAEGATPDAGPATGNFLSLRA